MSYWDPPSDFAPHDFEHVVDAGIRRKFVCKICGESFREMSSVRHVRDRKLSNADHYEYLSFGALDPKRASCGYSLVKTVLES